MVQGEVALLRAETPAARLGPGRAAGRGDPDAAADHGLAHRQPAGRRPAQGRHLGTDLYNIQQQLVQLQELTGQSQQRLSELRTQLEARGAQIETTRRRAAPRARATRAQPEPAPPSASADQMYEASLAQLRRGSTGTARLGLREMLRTYPDQLARARRAVLHRPELRRGESRTRRRRTTRRWWTSTRPPPGRRRRCTTWACSPSGGRTPPRPRTPTSAWCRSIPSRTRPRWLVIA